MFTCISTVLSGSIGEHIVPISSSYLYSFLASLEFCGVRGVKSQSTSWGSRSLKGIRNLSGTKFRFIFVDVDVDVDVLHSLFSLVYTVLYTVQ